MSASTSITPAEWVVNLLAREIEEEDVVATGVASPLAILAIAVARATHAPGLTYLACVGSLNPDLPRLFSSSEDLGYLEGRSAEVTIPDLFDHSRRGRVNTVFFGAAEVDAAGRTNMTASGSLERPRMKFPGVAGAATLRHWVHRPVLLVPRQSKRNLVPQVQVVTTRDDVRPVKLITDLGVFELGMKGARLMARHPWASVEQIRERTGFCFEAEPALALTAEPEARSVAAIRRIDPDRLRESLVGS